MWQASQWHIRRNFSSIDRNIFGRAQKRSAEHSKRRTCARMQNNCQTLTQTERPRPTCSQATRAASKRRHPKKQRNFFGRAQRRG
ncbi:MAG: hypothetical protein ACK55I_08390, partial [bacterium]